MDRGPLSLFGLVAALAGCNSILGIQESPARPETDASFDRNSNPGPLTCAWRFASHRKVVDLSSKSGPARLFGQNLLASPVPGHGYFRVVASHDGVDGPLELYTIDTTALGNAPTPQLVGAREQLQQVVRISGANTGILSASAGDEAGTTVQFVLYTILDDDKPASSVFTEYLLDTAVLGGVSEANGLASERSTSYYSLATSFHASSGEHSVALTRKNAGTGSAPIVLASDADEANVQERAIVDTPDTTYVFVGMPQARLGARVFAVPFGATAPAAPQALSNASTFLLAASLTDVDRLDVAFVDLANQVTLLTGQVALSNLGSFQASSLTPATTFGGLTDVPYAQMPQWIGDNLVTVGSTGAAATDLTIIWADARGNLRAHQRLDQVPAGSKLGAAAFSPQTNLGDFGGALDVVWVVTSVDPDGGEPYDVMYYDEVQCL